MLLSGFLPGSEMPSSTRHGKALKDHMILGHSVQPLPVFRRDVF